MALRIIEKNHRWGYIGCTKLRSTGSNFKYNESNSFPMRPNNGDSAFWHSAILWPRTGSAASYMLCMRFYDSWRGAWGSEDTNDRVGWHVMSDGTMVLSILPSGPVTKQSLQWFGGYLFDSFPDNAKFTKNGEPYTVRLMKCGYNKLGAGGGLSGDEEYQTYVLGSGEANIGTWGNWVTWSLDHHISEESLYPDRDDLDDGTFYNGSTTYVSLSYTVKPVGNLSTHGVSPNTDTNNPNSSNSAVFRLIAIPDDKWVDITGQTSYGVQTGGFSVSFNMDYPDGSTVKNLTVMLDSTTVLSETTSATGSRTVNIPESMVQSLASGTHSISISCQNATGAHTTTLSATFIKADTMISVTGNKVDRDDMPTACKLVRSRVVASGGSEAWFVTNNANDAEPVWEAYTGESHTFQNKEKTASLWAVSWRAEISGGTTQQSRLIKQVAMAVV